MNRNKSYPHSAQRRAPRTTATQAHVQGEANTSTPPQPDAHQEGQAMPAQQQPRLRRTVGRPRPPRQLNVTPAVPKPQNLATVPTPLKNDPLFLSALVAHPGAEMRPTSEAKLIRSSATGLTDIATQCYQDFVATSTGFARRVPVSAFQYYAAVHAYAAVLKKHQMNGFQTTSEERSFADSVNDAALRPPVMLTSYLEGFGNTTLPSGRDILFRMKEHEYHEDADSGTIGWFGRVTAQTHYLYMEYPNLAVYTMRIQEDVLRTADHGRAPEWNLPAGIRPQAQGAGLPTPNLLGYAQSQILRGEQSRFLSEGGIAADGSFLSDNEDLPLCMSLLIAVQNEMNAAEKHHTLRKPTIQIDGSQAQIPLVRSFHVPDRRLERHHDVEMTAPVQLSGA